MQISKTYQKEKVISTHVEYSELEILPECPQFQERTTDKERGQHTKKHWIFRHQKNQEEVHLGDRELKNFMARNSTQGNGNRYEGPMVSLKQRYDQSYHLVESAISGVKSGPRSKVSAEPQALLCP